MEPEWFERAITGKRKHEQQQEREQWNRARWMTAHLLSIHSRSPVKPTDLFEWPEEVTARRNELKELSAAMNADPRFAKVIKI